MDRPSLGLADQSISSASSTLSVVTHALATLIESRDEQTGWHSGRVVSTAMAIFGRLDESASSNEAVYSAFVLHDIGKVAVPDAILLKPGPLTPREWTVMRRHPEIGADVLSEAIGPGFEDIISVIRHHHERWDGSGYPDGLAGNAIPVECRALAVADAFDAMTNDRPYRRAMTLEAALDELRLCAGIQFDPDAVAAFEELAA